MLGGGGVLGAYEVGMLRALSEAGVTPDVVVGTSVGAINGAFVAADPAGAATWLAGAWQGEALQRAFRETIFGRAARLARSGRDADHESQVQWLYDWWQRIDMWITENRPPGAQAPALSTGPAASPNPAASPGQAAE